MQRHIKDVIAHKWLPFVSLFLLYHANSGSVDAQVFPVVGGGAPAVGAGAVGGVCIDANGLLKHVDTLAEDDRLELLRAESTRMTASPESTSLANEAELRKVSLRRLGKVIASFERTDQPLPAEIRYLAGLNRLQYVFFDPESGDVILAGPAGGWEATSTGEVVGVHSRRPVLQLDDFVVALRYAHDVDPSAAFIGCSIEPTAEGLKNFAASMKKLKRRRDRSPSKQLFTQMARTMGPQDVKLFGIDGSTRFALKMVAADYLLKRIAMGHDPPPVPQVPSYLDSKANRRRSSGPQRQHRWWFVSHYDAIDATPDRLAYELRGQGVRVATAPQSAYAASQGGKKVEPAARQFAERFTRHFPEMARKILVFAELQNLVALSVVAELISQHQANRGVELLVTSANAPADDWIQSAYLGETVSLNDRLHVPKQVPSLVSYRRARGGGWLFSVSGGVEINPAQIVGSAIPNPANADKLSAAREQNQPPTDPTQWWWD